MGHPYASEEPAAQERHDFRDRDEESRYRLGKREHGIDSHSESRYKRNDRTVVVFRNIGRCIAVYVFVCVLERPVLLLVPRPSSTRFR